MQGSFQCWQILHYAEKVSPLLTFKKHYVQTFNVFGLLLMMDCHSRLSSV